MIAFQTISNTGQIMQTHKQVIDIMKNGNILIFVPKDMHEPLKVGARINVPISMIQPFFELNVVGIDAVSIYDKLLFMSSISNAAVKAFYSRRYD